MWTEYIIPSSLDEALDILAQNQIHAKIAAGTTDLMLELERGIRKEVEILVDITRLPGLDSIRIDDDKQIHIGPLVTHNLAAASSLLRQHAFPLVSASWQVGAPQIRNRGTIAGNLVTASPANDTITPLMALDASLVLASRRGKREVRLADFYTGVRKSVLQPDEMVVDIFFRALKNDQHGTFLKLGLRRAQAISVVNTAVLLDMDAGVISSAAITLGAVAPTIIRAAKAEEYLADKELTEAVITRAGELAAESARPIDDIRSSAAYRRAMVKSLVIRALRMIAAGNEKDLVPEHPVLLCGNPAAEKSPEWAAFDPEKQLRVKVNGKNYSFTNWQGKSLLRLLREDAGLTGSKEGCAEGECGACTIHLNGKAVMACLIPAPCASGAEIITVEGLAAGDKLHPVQDAFLDLGAVQCGYCTPGFIMSAVKLLEEVPHPTRVQVNQAISGNLCRCTGYYKIVQAIELAGKIESPESE